MYEDLTELIILIALKLCLVLIARDPFENNLIPPCEQLKPTSTPLE